jgi:hypothetical protein
MSETALRQYSRKDLEICFREMESELQRQLASRRELDRRAASGFTVFRFFETDENLFSDILKFLLDPRESHGQQSLFLGLFATRLERSGIPELDKAVVTREAGTFSILNYRRRIDLLINSPKLVIGIENKIDAKEGGNQIHDYYNHLRQTCRNDYCLVFLTSDGRPPRSISDTLTTHLRSLHKLYLLNYNADIHDWLSECKRQCQADKIRYFLDDVICYIQTHLQPIAY